MIAVLIIIILILILIGGVLVGALLGIMDNLNKGNYCDDYCPYKVKVERHEQ